MVIKHGDHSNYDRDISYGGFALQWDSILADTLNFLSDHHIQSTERESQSGTWCKM